MTINIKAIIKKHALKEAKQYYHHPDGGTTPHTIEAYGVKGMNSTPWRKTFKHREHLDKWADEHSAEIHATRDLEPANYHQESLDEATHGGFEPGDKVITPSRMEATVKGKFSPKHGNLPHGTVSVEHHDSRHPNNLHYYHHSQLRKADSYANKNARDLAMRMGTRSGVKESVDEAVEVNHDMYVFSHGRAPRGHGSWFFTPHRGGIDFGKHKEGRDYAWTPYGSYSDAKKHAQAWAKSVGHPLIHVAT